jgi:hypothetical protein
MKLFILSFSVLIAAALVNPVFLRRAPLLSVIASLAGALFELSFFSNIGFMLGVSWLMITCSLIILDFVHNDLSISQKILN